MFGDICFPPLLLLARLVFLHFVVVCLFFLMFSAFISFMFAWPVLSNAGCLIIWCGLDTVPGVSFILLCPTFYDAMCI